MSRLHPFGPVVFNCDLEVYDEGGYWESLDKGVLLKRFGEYRSLINLVKTALEQEGMKESDDAGQIADRIEEILRRLGRERAEGD